VNLQVLARMPEVHPVYSKIKSIRWRRKHPHEMNRVTNSSGWGGGWKRLLFPVLFFLAYCAGIAAVASYARSVPPPPPTSARHKEKRNGNSRADVALRHVMARVQRGDQPGMTTNAASACNAAVAPTVAREARAGGAGPRAGTRACGRQGEVANCLARGRTSSA
jgi:hypothetical protein